MGRGNLAGNTPSLSSIQKCKWISYIQDLEVILFSTSGRVSVGVIGNWLSALGMLVDHCWPPRGEWWCQCSFYISYKVIFTTIIIAPSLSTMILFIFIVLVIIFMIFIFICLHLHSLHVSSFIFIHSLHLHSFVSFQSLSSSSFICLRSSWFIIFIFIHVSSYSCCFLPTVVFFQWHLHRATQRPGYASCSPIPSAWDFQQQFLSFKSSLLMRCNEVIVVYPKTTLVNHDGFDETWFVSTWVQNCLKHHSFRIGCVLLRVNGDMMKAPRGSIVGTL